MRQKNFGFTNPTDPVLAHSDFSFKNHVLRKCQTAQLVKQLVKQLFFLFGLTFSFPRAYVWDVIMTVYPGKGRADIDQCYNHVTLKASRLCV